MPRRRPALTLQATRTNLSRLARALQEGQLVAVPSETVYGLAGHALDEKACRAIFSAKGRPTNDPLIVHIHSLHQWWDLAQVSDAALRLAKAFWPGPLTIVLPKKARVPDLCTSGLPSVAVRMPSHPIFRALLKASGLPLAAPSANPFGYLSPTTAAHVKAHLGRKIPFILDGGASAIGVESTIVDLRKAHRPAILRPGAISAEEIAAVLGVPVKPYRPRKVARGHAAVAPGLLSQHYSPRTPLVLAKEGALAGAKPGAGEALVVLRRPTGQLAKGLHWLSTRGALREVARNLFSCLQKLDTKGLRRIRIECPAGDEPLAVALRDRLTRAAAKR